MNRTSYLSELEFRYLVALKFHSYACGEGTNFQLLLIEYID